MDENGRTNNIGSTMKGSRTYLTRSRLSCEQVYVVYKIIFTSSIVFTTVFSTAWEPGSRWVVFVVVRGAYQRVRRGVQREEIE